MEIRAVTSYARDVNDRVISRMFEIVAGTLIQRSSGPYSRLFTARFLELYTRAAELSAGAKTSVHRTMHPPISNILSIFESREFDTFFNFLTKINSQIVVCDYTDKQLKVISKIGIEIVIVDLKTFFLIDL